MGSRLLLKQQYMILILLQKELQLTYYWHTEYTMVSRCGCSKNELYGQGQPYGFSQFKYQPVQVKLEVDSANIKQFLLNSFFKCYSFSYIPGFMNPSGVLSKQWGYNNIWYLVQPLLFWKRDTANTYWLYVHIHLFIYIYK